MKATLIQIWRRPLVPHRASPAEWFGEWVGPKLHGCWWLGTHTKNSLAAVHKSACSSSCSESWPSCGPCVPIWVFIGWRTKALSDPEFRSNPFHRIIQPGWPGWGTKGLRHIWINVAFITGWNVKSRRWCRMLCDILLTEIGQSWTYSIVRSRFGKNGTNVVHYFVIRTKVLLETTTSNWELRFLQIHMSPMYGRIRVHPLRIPCSDDTNAPTCPDLYLDRRIEGLVPRRISVASHVLQPERRDQIRDRKHVIPLPEFQEASWPCIPLAGHGQSPVRGGYKNSRVSIEDAKDGRDLLWQLFNMTLVANLIRFRKIRNMYVPQHRIYESCRPFFYHRKRSIEAIRVVLPEYTPRWRITNEVENPITLFWYKRAFREYVCDACYAESGNGQSAHLYC